MKPLTQQLTAPALSVGARIVELGQVFCVTQQELISLLAEFEDGDEWLVDGAPTAAHWIADRLDICVSTAREWLRIGKALVDLPGIRDAYSGNELSYSKIRSLTRVATVDNEVELVALARRIPADALGCALAAWSNRHEAPEVRDARHRRDRSFSTRTEPDGSVSGYFRLPPDAAANLKAAVEARMMHQAAMPRSAHQMPTNGGIDASADAWPSLGQQRADALVDLVTNGGADITTEVVVHVRGDGCAYDDGTPVTDTVIERLAPTAFIRALIHDADSRPVDATNRRRHPTARQKRLVRERDRTCVDCEKTELLEFDHVPDFETTGHTVTTELTTTATPHVASLRTTTLEPTRLAAIG